MKRLEARMERVIEAMRARGLEQMLVCDPDAIWYLTAYDVLPFERMLVLLLRTDGAHGFVVNRLFPKPEGTYRVRCYADSEDPVAALADWVDADRPLGIDKNWPARFLLPLMEARPGLRCREASDCVDSVRAVKDAHEVALMRESSRINDQVMERAAAYVREGMTEREVAAYISAQYIELGCESVAFEPIVSFGGNAADPHHEPDGSRLRKGDCIVFDIGGKKARYCSDMTRTFFCGEPSGKQRAVHDLVRRANEAAEARIKPGVPLSELDGTARRMIAEAGYGDYFTHRLGHFIGQTEHEKGDVSSASPLVAEPGMIFSIEPGIYIPGEIGVRIEDLVLVTETGCEVLNKIAKTWRSIG